MIHKLITIITFGLIISSYANENQFLDKWTPLYKGVDYQLSIRNEGALKIHQIKIDATDPEVDIFVTEPKKGKNATAACKPSTFLSKHKAQVVVNGTGYAPANLSNEGVDKTPETLSIYKGRQYAPSKGENAAFVVLKDGSKRILKAEEYDLYKDEISMAVGAWPWAGLQGLLIENGANLVPTEFDKEDFFARSALGISKDGKNVYLVVIEGKPRKNMATIYESLVGQGVLLSDLINVMLELDCDRAINLDGGGSSVLVVENVITNTPLILNVPSDHKGERAVGSHIGISAPHIEDEEQLITFRKLQESTAFFDLLQKNHSRLSEIYHDPKTLDTIDSENIQMVDDLYKNFGIKPYYDFNKDYNLLLNQQNLSFNECFLQNNNLDFYCGNPKEFADQINFNPRDFMIRLSDLKFVGEKQTGYTQGGTYIDSNKVFYFVKHAQSVKNELIGSRLMNLILGSNHSPVVMLLEDNPEMIASRMVKGFMMKRDFEKKKLTSAIKDVAALDIVSSFIGLIDRHNRNVGYVETSAETVVGARIDFDHSFAFNSAPIGIPQLFEKNDPQNLSHLYYTLKNYPLEDIMPTLETIISIPDEQITMLLFECWIALSQIQNNFTLQDAFNLSAQLIDRKQAFKDVFTALNQDAPLAEAERTRILEEQRKKEEAEIARIQEEQRKREEAERARMLEEQRKKAEAKKARFLQEQRKRAEAERVRILEEQRKKAEAERVRILEEQRKKAEAKKARKAKRKDRKGRKAKEKFQQMLNGAFQPRKNR